MLLPVLGACSGLGMPGNGGFAVLSGWLLGAVRQPCEMQHLAVCGLGLLCAGR